MSLKQELDLNIGNWSVPDLYELFDIPKDATTEEVAEIADKVIQKQTEGELKYFLQLARDKIIKSQESALQGNIFQKNTDRQLELWWKNQYLESGNAVQSDKVTSRKDKVEIFDDADGHFQMKQNRLGVNQTYNLPHVQGTINPNLKTQIERVVIVDSQYRTNLYPYAGNDVSKPSFNTDFTVTLSENLTNVTEIQLEAINIPKTWYNFDTFYGNTCFAIDNLTNTEKTLINITPGNYTPQTLSNHINDLLQEGAPGLGQIDLSFNYDNRYNKFKFVWNPHSTSPDSTHGYKIYFYRDDNFTEYISNTGVSCQGCVTTMYPNNSFGWTSGWRITPDENDDVFLTIDTSGIPYNADATPQIEPISNLIIVLDDFNKNRLNTGVVSSTQQSEKLSIPEYVSLNNLDCATAGEGAVFSKVAPRQLTQAQLYTLNTIVEGRRQSRSRNAAPTTSDAFCIIPVIDSTEINKNIVLMANQLSTYKREYFGPVNIERLRARLIDDKGNIVNLNGRDWSFTLRVKQLYQY